MTTPLSILKKESYLAMIHNAVGSNLFRNLYMLVDGEKEDIVRDGQRSCALFVSSILHQFQLITLPHATVAGLERDLQESGWTRVESPKAGDILIWEPKMQTDGEAHAHAGFYLDEDTAISNSDKERVPVQHHMTFGAQRAIVAVYTHTFLI
jgi:hypothetical protein